MPLETFGLYRRLDVGPGASSEEIGRAYRRLAHDAHPDAHPDDPGASRRFQEITEAYEILIDPGRRARYDRAHDQSAARSIASADNTRRVRRPSRWTPTFAASPTPAAPVLIGIGPVSTGSAPLVAGPVYLESVPPSEGLRSPRKEEFPDSDLARLFTILVGPRW